MYYYGGSTPREIFEECIEGEKEILKKLKPSFKQLVKSKGIRFADSTFETFEKTLLPFEEYCSLSQFEKTLIHEYYLEKVKQKEQETANELSRVKDEIQYRLKKKIDLKVSNKVEDYL